MDAIVVEGLEKTYGKETRALDGISFTVPEGEDCPGRGFASIELPGEPSAYSG